MADAGFPVPQTQMEYDGDHHRSNRRQYVKDQRRKLGSVGWIVVRVIAEDRPGDVVDRLRRAFALPAPASIWRPARLT